MPFDYYRIFYYVAKYKSFSKAAKFLHNNQPNITRCMNIMESELGCTLFIRSHRGIKLTPEGEQLYAHVAIAIQQISSGNDELNRTKNLKSGTVTIGVSETALHFPFISLNEGTATRNFYEKYFYQNQLVFSPDMETATTNQILSLVQHDLGIGFCPEALAKDYLDRGEIIEIPVKEHANPRDICLLTDSTRPIGIAGKKLLEILMDSEG